MIYLMRHGESINNVTHRITCREHDGDLTDKGRDQAKRAGHWLLGKGIQAIYTSPFQRAYQTAVGAGEVLGLTPDIDVDLSELDCGQLEGRSDPQAWEIVKADMDRWKNGEWDAKFAGGESLRQAHDRLQRALLRASQFNYPVLLVTHGGMFTRVLPYLLNREDSSEINDDIANTGIATLEPCDGGRYICGGWNLVEHLAVE